MKTTEDFIYCIHCEAVYTESEQIRQTTPQTLYSPEEERIFCPHCHETAEDNKEATPEQIDYFNNY